MGCKLFQRAACDSAVELLGALAILRGWEVSSPSLHSPDKYCQYQKGRTQHFSRQPKRLGRLLATARLGPRRRRASQGIRANDRRAIDIKNRRLGQLSRRAARESLRYAVIRIDAAHVVWRLDAVISWNRRLSLFDTALRREIDCEAAEPVPAFVMFAGHRCEPGSPVRFRCAR